MDQMLRGVLILLALLLTTAALAGERAVRPQVDNMDCVACPVIVKRSLARVSGVAAVKVSYAERTASVTYDDARATIPMLIEATTRAGYPSRVLK